MLSSLLFVTLIVLILLKCAGVILVSWWIVLLPLWIWLAVFLILTTTSLVALSVLMMAKGR